MIFIEGIYIIMFSFFSDNALPLQWRAITGKTWYLHKGYPEQVRQKLVRSFFHRADQSFTELMMLYGPDI
jgi:hypothetical protein